MESCRPSPDFLWSECSSVVLSAPFKAFAIVCLCGYIPFVFTLQALMQSRPPMKNLDGILRVWNATMSILSIIGFLTNVSHLRRCTFEESYTEMGYSNGFTGFVVMLFNLSKMPEMVDTVFIVLRKKSLLPLHWFHHLTVAVYCWSTITVPTPIGFWFSLMNMFVHGLMYSYFAFAHQLRQLGFNPMILTVLQISQMVWGLVICLLFAIHPNTTFNVSTVSNLIYAVPMYASYLYLFCKFFNSKYRSKKNV